MTTPHSNAEYACAQGSHQLIGVGEDGACLHCLKPLLEMSDFEMYRSFRKFKAPVALDVLRVACTLMRPLRVG